MSVEGRVETKAELRSRSQVMEDISSGSFAMGTRKNAEKVTLNDFELIQQIGRGAFGVVFLATLPKTGQRFAIKTIRKDKLIDSDAIDCIRNEIDILLKAQHKYLCSIDYFF